MALKARITDDLKAALLGGDRFKGDTLRVLKAAILNEEVAQNKRDEGLDDSIIEQIVAKEVKKRNEAADLYDKNNRSESATDERREAEILQSYLPQQLSDDALKAIVEAVILETGANGIGDMGKTIGVVKAKVGNTAEGSAIARIVKEQLS
jgi:uncharacterized protein